MSDDFLLNSIKVDKWNSVQNGNDCWWNIAKNQAGEGASATEINKIMEELQAYNAEKNSSVVRKNDVLHTGEQIFIPLEYAMDEIKTGVEAKVGEVTTAQTNFTTANDSLISANSEVATTLKNYETAKAAYDNIDSADNKTDVENEFQEAKRLYLAALEAQAKAQKDYEAEQSILVQKQAELTSMKEELQSLQEEYADEKSEYEAELAELEAQIATIDEEIGAATTAMTDAEASMTTATADQEKAAELGAKQNEDGTFTIDEDAAKTEDEEGGNGSGDSEKAYKIGDVQEAKDVETGETIYYVVEDGKQVMVDKDDIDFGEEADTEKKYTMDDVRAAENANGEIIYFNKETGEAVDPSEIEGVEEADDGKKTETEEETELRADLALARAQYLHASMAEDGTDNQAVINLMRSIGGQDMIDVAEAYKELTGKSLEDAFKADFAEDGEEATLGELLSGLSTAQRMTSYEREEISKEKVLEAQAQAFDQATINFKQKVDGGTLEDVLTDIIIGMTPEELKEFEEYYNSTHDKDLTQVIKDETSGDDEEDYRLFLVSAVESARNYEAPKEMTEEELEAQRRADYNEAMAMRLHAAMQETGTHDETVLDIINKLGFKELSEIKSLYYDMYGQHLIDVVSADFAEDGEETTLATLLNSLNNADRYSNQDYLKEITDADVAMARSQAFQIATVNRDGCTDEEVANDILNLSPEELKAVNEALLKTNRGTLKSYIEKEFEGDAEKAMLRRLKEYGI